MITFEFFISFKAPKPDSIHLINIIIYIIEPIKVIKIPKILAFSIVIYLYNTVVFTGVVKSLGISPSLRCAGEIIVRAQGEDILYKLENRNITRRQKLSGLGPIAFISSLSTKRTSIGFDDPPSRYGIDSSNSPIEFITHSINPEEQTQMMKDN